MELFGHITKALRWGASSLFGKKGRDVVDKYGPLIEEASGLFLPLINGNDDAFVRIHPDIIKREIKDWAKFKGVPVEDVERFANQVLRGKQ